MGLIKLLSNKYFAPEVLPSHCAEHMQERENDKRVKENVSSLSKQMNIVYVNV